MEDKQTVNCLQNASSSTDDQALDLRNEEEEEEAQDKEDEEIIDDSFLCCVCLDLLYKPVVLACGHISCFWCVHRAMNGIGESHCPICRFPYYHFPSICQFLHFLLLKMYPITYRRREKQVLEEEKKLGCFSPQFNDNISRSHTRAEVNSRVSPSTSSTICSQIISHTDTCSSGNMNPSISELQNLCVQFQENATKHSGETYAGLEGTRTSAVEGNILPEKDPKGAACELVSSSDMLCVACQQLLFRPVVLNCGHVYCESCIISIAVDEALTCQLCQRPHPKGFPKVCLELDHFLEKKFSREYAMRSEAVQRQPVQCQQGGPSVCARQDGKQGTQLSSSPTQGYLSLLEDRGLHIGAGCDYCGMYPIVGERYKCVDCVEEIGFDLCEECYNTRSKLPGRFNQQHTPEHKFELVPPHLIRTIMRRMASEHSEDGSTVLVLSDDASEDPEDGHAPEDPGGGIGFSI